MWAKVTLAYDGSRFFGSQSLTDPRFQPTVLGKLEEVLNCIGIKERVQAAGRTDRGVHATAQVVSFALPPHWQGSALRLQEELTRQLWPLMDIRRVELFATPFHARYDARSRVYRYLISPTKPSSFQAPYMAWAPDFDPEAAREAARLFIGRHDFIHFSKRGSDENNTVRHLKSATLYRHRSLHIVRFEANAFLRSQVRLMIAAILTVAAGKAQPHEILRQLHGDRVRFRIPAPAGGLYLCGVRYRS